MGNNYYYFKEEINPEVVPPEAGLHIGKLSYGWVFHFQAHPSKALSTYHQWKMSTKRGAIYDEYGRYLTYEEFWDLVDSSKETIDGITPLDFDTCPQEERSIYNVDEYMCNGFMFTDCDFS